MRKCDKRGVQLRGCMSPSNTLQPLVTLTPFQSMHGFQCPISPLSSFLDIRWTARWFRTIVASNNMALSLQRTEAVPSIFLEALKISLLHKPLPHYPHLSRWVPVWQQMSSSEVPVARRKPATVTCARVSARILMNMHWRSEG